MAEGMLYNVSSGLRDILARVSNDEVQDITDQTMTSSFHHQGRENSTSGKLKDDWKKPSTRTVGIIRTLFRDMIDPKTGELDMSMIESALTLCPPDENLLLVEDRDHYNLMHKAIILNNVAFVHLLLNHGCPVDSINPEEVCALSRKKCSHRNLGALHLSCFLGRKEIAGLLLRRGADRLAPRRVYTSAVLNCPQAAEQEDILRSGYSEYVSELVFKCGDREPVFYAVLGDHIEVVQLLFGEQFRKPLPEYSYLLHLAARAGAYNCLQVLIRIYPDEVNTSDSDGLPPLLMGMRHGLRFVELMLIAGADIHFLDDFWEKDTNILHLLFKSLPFPDTAQASLAQVVSMCIKEGAGVNSRRQPSGSTPLHDLLTAVNIPDALNVLQPEKNPADCEVRLRNFDDNILECLHVLLQSGADVRLEDANRKTPLQLLLSNGNHTVRLNAAKHPQAPPQVQRALRINDYGLQNTIKITRLLLERDCLRLSSAHSRSTPLRDLIELMCSSYFGSGYWHWRHSLEILGEPSNLSAYCELAEMLLQRGCDPNASAEDQLPPLLYILSHITDSPYSDDYVISLETALATSSFVEVLLRYGAKLECEMETRRGYVRVTGCFDMLMSVFETMQDYPQSRTASDLATLSVFVVPILQYGARSVVYQKLLYGDPGNAADVPWCYCIPTHSFLYQFLQFGALNLHYVNDGNYYLDLFEIIYNHADHYTLQDVLSNVFVQFVAAHEPQSCSCGECARFGELLNAYAHRPRSLKQLARLVVLNHMTEKRPQAIDRLALPVALRAYLKYYRT